MLRGVLPTAESNLKTSAQYPTLITSAHYPTLITSAQYPTLNISAHCPTLKGQCHEIFGPFLKKKKTLFSFCEDICKNSRKTCVYVFTDHADTG